MSQNWYFILLCTRIFKTLYGVESLMMSKGIFQQVFQPNFWWQDLTVDLLVIYSLLSEHFFSKSSTWTTSRPLSD